MKNLLFAAFGQNYISGMKNSVKGRLFFQLITAVSIMCMLMQSTIKAKNYSLSAGPVGFATVNGTTTGGGNATPETVKTYIQLKNAVSDSIPRVIIVSGTIRTTDGDGYGLPIGSNKTIMGENTSSKIYGGFSIKNSHNVIIRNLNFNGSFPNPGPGDCIAVNNSHHVWIDHVSIWDADDGNLDITRESNYCTVSWCKFFYTNSKNDHRLCALIGSGGGDHPEDYDKLKVTYHHNWFDKLVKSRMPRLVYGQAHVYNNYYSSKGNSYCIGVGSYGRILIEKNYFKGVKNPHQFMYDVYCHMVARDNEYDNCKGGDVHKKSGSRHSGWKNPKTGEQHPKFEVQPFEKPPYDYTMDDTKTIPDLVSKYAGPQSDVTSLISNCSPSTIRAKLQVPLFNLVNKTLSFDISSSEIVEVTIYSLNGKKVVSKMVQATPGIKNIEISITNLMNGIYLISIDKNGTIVNSVVNLL